LPPSLLELAARAAWPLLAEPTSNLRIPRALTAGQLLLGDESFAPAHVPEVVLQFGAAPTSRAALELVRRAGRLVIVDQDHVVADPHRRASWTLRAEAAAVVPEVLDGLEPKGDTPWLSVWSSADAIARRTVDELLDGWDTPSEPRVARDLAAGLPDGATLIVGSSMPVRDLDAFMAPRRGLGVIANRGASGIDGFVSTVLGVGAAGRPTVGLLGDLTFLHDVGSLLWSARRGHDAVLVVLDNGGGSIFSFLSQRDLPGAELEALFTTPHGLDLEAVCAAAGAGHTRIERADDLVPAVERGLATGGVHVVQVRIDPQENIRRHAEARDAVAAALLDPG
jgi:2-succinyl-5-enolpyruvyl-6-hydroxy-3-cyclohexene-1-carboxylate synthase